MLTPVAVFAYKRAKHLKRLLDSLSSCVGFSDTPVTIFVDGPRAERDVAEVQEVRNLVASLPYQNVEHCFSEANLGLKQSISKGVTQVCSQAGRVIVIEDDLLLSRSALQYFNQGLERFSTDESVWSIVGYSYDAAGLRQSNRALVLPFAHPWGWATWKRCWDRFDIEAPISSADLNSSTFRSLFDMAGLYPFSNLLRLADRGKVNSWFIRWYYCVFQHGGTSIFPSRRVVDNFGFNAGGTHSGVFTPYDLVVKRPGLFDGDVEFPAPRAGVDYWALDLMKAGWELRMHRAIARAGAMRRGDWALWK